MALTEPSEEERVLLREYRINTLPIKKYQHSKQQHHEEKFGEGPIKKEDETQQEQPKPVGQVQAQELKQSSHRSKSKPSPSQKSAQHHHHHNHHHHHKHHKRKHKNSSTPVAQAELNQDDLIRMSDLASGLSYLNLVSPLKVKSNNKDNSTGEVGAENQNTFKAAISGNQAVLQTKNGADNKQYIFEKIDYIRRFNAWKKELTKLRRLRNKSRLIQSANVVAGAT